MMEEKNSDYHEKIYQLIATEKYQEALKLIYKMGAEREIFPESFLYEGICLYEEKNDLKCMMCMKEFISAHPLHEKKDYAIYTTAICLINLGVTESAVALLENLSETYPNRDKVLAEAKGELLHKLEATHFAEEIQNLIRI